MTSAVRPEDVTRRKTCAHCGTVFDCSTSIGCWCTAEPYRLPMPPPGTGEDCMCPACLRAHVRRLMG